MSTVLRPGSDDQGDADRVAPDLDGDALVAVVRTAAEAVLDRVRCLAVDVRAGACPSDGAVTGLASDIVRLDEHVARAMGAPRTADLPAVELARVQVATARRIVRELLAEVRPA